MANESYWTYQASESTLSVADLPAGVFNGTQSDWEKFSPGMRREIFRSWKRRNKEA